MKADGSDKTAQGGDELNAPGVSGGETGINNLNEVFSPAAGFQSMSLDEKNKI
jgi:hypothetical protein